MATRYLGVLRPRPLACPRCLRSVSRKHVRPRHPSLCRECERSDRHRRRFDRSWQGTGKRLPRLRGPCERALSATCEHQWRSACRSESIQAWEGCDDREVRGTEMLVPVARNSRRQPTGRSASGRRGDRTGTGVDGGVDGHRPCDALPSISVSVRVPRTVEFVPTDLGIRSEQVWVFLVSPTKGVDQFAADVVVPGARCDIVRLAYFLVRRAGRSVPTEGRAEHLHEDLVAVTETEHLP